VQGEEGGRGRDFHGTSNYEIIQDKEQQKMGGEGKQIKEFGSETASNGKREGKRDEGRS